MDLFRLGPKTPLDAKSLQGNIHEYDDNSWSIPIFLIRFHVKDTQGLQVKRFCWQVGRWSGAGVHVDLRKPMACNTNTVTNITCMISEKRGIFSQTTSCIAVRCRLWVADTAWLQEKRCHFSIFKIIQRHHQSLISSQASQAITWRVKWKRQFFNIFW